MAGRSPARFIAPLALVAFALALFIVVSNTTKDDAGTPGARDSSPAAESSASPEGEGGKRKKKTPRTYTIKSGDTPSGIAEKVNVPLETILELNPDLDPQALPLGEKIKLR